MTQYIKKNYKTIIYIFACLLVSVACAWYMNKSYYLILSKDDGGMRSIANGNYTGTPDGHLVYIKYVIGWIISRLYLIDSTYNWYGIVFQILIFGAFSLALISMRREKNRMSILICGALTFLALVMPAVLELNFSISAAIVGGTAVFLLTKSDATRATRIMGIFFWWLCYCIREDVFYIVCAYVGLHIVIYLLSHKDSIRRLLGKIGIYIVIWCGLFGGTLIIENLAYSSKEWHAYKQYNGARSLIMDYYGWPNYSEAQEIYEKYGVSEELYDTFCDNGKLYMEGIDMPGLVQDIGNYLTKKQNGLNKKELLIQGIYRLRKTLFAEDYALINLFILGLGGYIFGWVWAKKNRIEMLELVFGFGGYGILWYYLALQGRVPFRACYSLQLVMLAFLLALNARRGAEENRQMEQKMIEGIVIFVLLLTVYSNRKELDELSTYNLKRNMDIVQVMEYCESHPNNVFWIEDGYYAFERANGIHENIHTDNVVYYGGWITYSPLFDRQKCNLEIGEGQLSLLNSQIHLYLAEEDKEANNMVNQMEALGKNCTVNKTGKIKTGYIISDHLNIYQFCDK